MMIREKFLHGSRVIQIVTLLSLLVLAANTARLQAANPLPVLLDQSEVTQADGKDFGALLQQAFPSFTKNLIDYLTTLNYNTAQDAVITIPNTGYSINTAWGFGGSGSIFEPLPSTAVTLKPTAAGTTNDAFSIATLGSMIINDGLIAHSQQLPILKWFANKRLSPLNLFSLKVFLLIKDFRLGLFDKNFVNTEITRLVTRLTLALDQKAVGSLTKLSSLIPSFLGDTAGILTPETTQMLEDVLKNLARPQPKDLASFEKFLPKTTFACAFASQESADIYFKSLQHGNAEIMMNGTDIVMYKDDTTDAASTTIPLALIKEAQATTQLPALVRAQDDNGNHWIGYVTNQLDMTDTFKMLSSCFISTMKQYVAARKEFYVANPQASSDYAEKNKIQQLNAQRIYAFLNSEAGKASAERIKKALEINKPQTNSVGVQELNNALSSKFEKLNALRADQNQAQSILENYRNNKFDPKTIQILEEDIAQRQRKIDGYKEYIETENRLQAAAVVDSAQAQAHYVAELHRMAAQFKKSGEVVPAELTAMIAQAEKKPTQTSPAPNASPAAVADFIKQQELLVAAYEHEIAILENNLCRPEGPYRMDAQGLELQKIADIEFQGIIAPRYRAYIDHLSEKVADIKAQISNINTLLYYRDLIKTNGSELAPEQKQKYRALENSVGWIIDNRPTDGILHNLMNTSDVKEFVSDVFGSNKHFSPVREYFFSVLHMILNQSGHVKAMPHTYGYIIGKFAPEYLATFNKIVE